MEKHIALLRGVNVGGHTVKMDRLKSLFEGMGFGSVYTYIQSGNVFFEAPSGETVEALRARIESVLQETLGFAVPALLQTLGQLEATLAANPYTERVLAEGERVYITLLGEEPTAEAMEKLKPIGSSRDEFALFGRAVYILCRDGYHNTAYTNNYLERILKVTTTTRNLETLGKLAKLAGETK